MKTEKRLTMALSVLVALMMLAVPLASSSNLFVDGGQTNSNGDAPVLGASTGYTVTFQLNADGKSLDQTTDLNDLINAGGTGLNAVANFNNKVTWYAGENNTLIAMVINDPANDTIYSSSNTTGNLTIQDLIDALFGASGSIIEKSGYTLTAWKDENSNSYNADTSATDPILKSMTFAAQWELNQGFIEVPVNVNFDGDVKEYVKAYKVAEGKIAIGTAAGELSADALKIAVQDVGKLNIEGYVINITTPALTKVYSEGKVTYADGKELPTGTDKTIPSTSSLTVTYTFNDAKYAKLTVHSVAFKDGKDVTLYADKDQPYNYKQIFDALKSAEVNAINGAKAVANSVNYETKDGKYLLTGWDNGAANLESTYQTTADEFTLDAKLNGYSVVFMVNGQYEVVFINFGELTADKCTLNVAGLNHWVWIPFKGDSSLEKITQAVTDVKTNPFSVFDFNMSSNIKSIEDLAAKDTYVDPDVPVAAIIACFETTGNTAYAVFDANSGYFGNNENISKIVIPGKANTAVGGGDSNAANIPLPSSNPIYDENIVFTGYTSYIVNEKVSKYDVKDTTKYFKAEPKSYKHTITFQDGDKIIGVLYMPDVSSGLTFSNLSGATAVQYDGKMYSDSADVSKYLDKILNTKKDGYDIKQWNNVDGEKMISVGASPGTTNKFTSLTSNLVLYAQFDAKSYTIKYVNTFGGEQNQIAYVDQNTTLYGTGTFIHEGYDLKAWSTVPGNSGDKYDLGATFVLNGADFEKLAESAGDDGVVIELYSVWDYNGGSDVPGGNTGGDSNDNTALYLIAGMLAVIAILAIVGIVLMRKK